MKGPPAWRLPAALAFALALLTALGALHAVFVQEREDALENVASREAAVLAFAKSALVGRLAALLEEARPRLRQALEDPLVDDQGLLLVLDGAVRLPRAKESAPGEETEALTRLAALSEKLSALSPGAPLPAINPYLARVQHLGALRRSLEVGDRQSVEASVRALLAEMTRTRLPPREDVPHALALAEALVGQEGISPALLHGLLKDGLGEGASRIEGVQRRLLASRAAFTRPDFEGLAARVLELSARARVPAEDFVARVKDAAPRAVEVPPDLDGPSLLAEGRVYAEPSEGVVEGIAVDLEQELSVLASGLVARGLLSEGSALAVISGRRASGGALASLSLTLASPAFEIARKDARVRYRMKAGLLVGTGALAGLALALSFALDRRRRRFYELKARFLSAVSHELRTPLASLQLLAETLERRVGALPEARDYPRRMLKDLEGLSFLVENLLSLQRVEKGRLSPRKERVDLEEVVCALEDELARVTDARVELAFDAEDDACELSADPELLTLCLANLLRNACLYNARDPVEICVTARSTGSVGRRQGLAPSSRGTRQEPSSDDVPARLWTRPGTAVRKGAEDDVIVRVADNGVGIPEELRPRLFEDFVRGPDLAKKSARGSGIGLALCRDIAVAHGGSLALVESSPSGSVFELRLPRGDGRKR